MKSITSLLEAGTTPFLVVATITVVLLVLSVFGIIGGFCWPYAINTWLEWAGKEPAIGWWHGFGLGYVPGLGQLSIPAAAVTWVVSFFV